MTLNRDNNKVTILSSFIVQLKTGWFHGAEVERWSLTGELSLSCARRLDQQLTGNHLCG